MKKQILCFVLVLLLVIFSVPAYTVSAFLVADVIYTQENNWEGTLELTSNQTVKLKDIIHENSGTMDRGSAIKISENATVNLIFEGTCVLAGNPDYISAGIEVSEGSRVNIDGLNGSSLTVTGGKWSAGIGGVGYGSASTGNSKAGNIHIYSGTIKAIGGRRGAGIGSGYHSSASDIFIEGGNVTAIGTECGAGIGSGYGTSGGTAFDAAGNVTASGVGYYNGGNITINGNAVVKAAAYPINFDNFDPYNTDTLYGEGHENTHAAGIGGGYGASSGTIVIAKSAKVTAIGASGGAGIGSGRGTSKPKNFDDKNYAVRIRIRDNAQVFAYSASDTRENQQARAGAAIGHGYGNGLEGDSVGEIKIDGSSRVYAVGAYHAQAIGGSHVVGLFEEGSVPPLAEIKALDLSETATIVVISDGYYKPIARTKFYKEKEFISLNFSDEFFKENASFFTEEKFPLKIKAFDHENERVNTTFSIQKPNKTNVTIFLPRASNYYFELKDYQTEDGECVYLANDINVPSSSFLASKGEMAEYSSIELTSQFRSSVILETTDGPVKVSLRANEGVFSLGSIFSASVIQDTDRIAEIRSRIDSECLEDIDKLYFFDLSVSDPKGQPYENLLGSVNLLIQILDGWDPNNMLLLYPTEGQDEVCRLVSVALIQGKKHAKIELTHFSDYVLAVYKEKIPEGVVTENLEISTEQGVFTTSPTNSEAKKSPQTAETGAVCLGFLGLGVLALLKKKA